MTIPFTTNTKRSCRFATIHPTPTANHARCFSKAHLETPGGQLVHVISHQGEQRYQVRDCIRLMILIDGHQIHAMTSAPEKEEDGRKN